MVRPKNNAGETTRDVVEGFIWAATGWRGDPGVIDSILSKMDDYTTAQCARVAIAQAPVVAPAPPPVPSGPSEAEQARYAALEEQVTAAQAARTEALASVAALTEQLTAALADLPAIVAPEPEDPEPIVERVRVGELLELLSTASGYAAAALTACTHTMSAINALADGMRAADGMAKDLVPSHAEPLAEPEPTPEPPSILQAAQERYRATVEAIDRRRADEGFTQRLARAIEVNADALERLADGPEDLAVFPDPEAIEPARDVNGSDPVADALMEIEAEMRAEAKAAERAAQDAAVAALLAGDGTKECSRCKKHQPYAHYYRDRSAPDGFMYNCKDCKSTGKKEPAPVA